jgi:hypothetical protein
VEECNFVSKSEKNVRRIWTVQNRFLEGLQCYVSGLIVQTDIWAVYQCYEVRNAVFQMEHKKALDFQLSFINTFGK